MSTSAEHKSIKPVFDTVYDLNGLKKVGPLNSELTKWLRPLAVEKVFYRKWDFDGGVFDDDYWTEYHNAGTGFAIPATRLQGGTIQGVTGATSGDAIALVGQPIYKGDNRAYLHVRWKSSAVANFMFELGFIDAVTTPTSPICSDIDVPTVGNGAGDLAIVVMDTSQTLTTMGFVTKGSTSGMTAAKQNIGTLSPTADTYQDFKMMIDGNDIEVIIDNKRVFRKTKVFGIEGGTLVKPWLYFRTRTTAARTVNIDLIEAAGERA